MYKVSFLFCLFFFLGSAHAQLQVSSMVCEHKVNPTGVDQMVPRFSWKILSKQKDVLQTAYEIRFAAMSGIKKTGSWKSFKFNSDQSINQPYVGPALRSEGSYGWQVRVWDNHGAVSPWSEVAYWQMGLLKPTDWVAQWISNGREDSIDRPSPLFRKSFVISKSVQRVSVYLTAHGLYESWINGNRVGDAFLTPGWTSYKKRLQYQAYDITPNIHQGINSFAVMLGSGWYRGYIGFEGNKNVFGKDLSFLCQLNIEYADGTNQQISSDTTWKWALGGVKSSEIYNGETFDANLQPEDWNKESFNDHAWASAKEVYFAKDNLIGTYNEPVKAHELLHPIKIFKTPKGDQVLDFGQNMVGWVRLQVQGYKGQRIVLTHGEILDKNGNFYVENLRSAQQQNVYILKGGRQETLEPHFTFQGFRFVKIEGWEGPLRADQFTGVVLYSDMQPTGKFSCSNELVNKLQQNIQWGQRGNFLDVPTDCPQRDERLGWTGDAQVFSRTAAFNFNVQNFFSKWLKDVAADQTADGMVPFVVPNVLSTDAGGAAGWADVATIVPWNLYLIYGDTLLLKTQYPSMKGWVDFMNHTAVKGIWTRGNIFGDWLFYRPNDDNSGTAAVTDKSLISEAFFIHSTDILVKTAHILGLKTDEENYARMAQSLRKVFVNEFVTPSGRLVSNTQTAYVLALEFNLIPDDMRKQAAERLVQNIQAYGYHLTTGFLGTSYLCEVLTQAGYLDIAYKLLLQESYPSWLYPVKMGATTIWERWDGQKPDSSFENPGMNSFNHYAYGAIGDFLYKHVAGIDTYEQGPGYKKIKLKPNVDSSLKEVSAEFETNYGNLGSHWKSSKELFTWDVTIPVNTRANLFFPGKAWKMEMDGKDFHPSEKTGRQELELGSGHYHFVLYYH